MRQFFKRLFGIKSPKGNIHLKLIGAGVLLTLAVGCAKKREAQPECGFVQNVYGERVSWKSNSAITLMVHNSVPDDMLPGVYQAVDTWNKRMNRQVFVIGQTQFQGSEASNQDNTNVIYWQTQWEANKTTEQARTSVYWVGDQIKDADIKINAKNFQFYISGSPNSSAIHLPSLLIHELGHVLGLKHKDGGDSVMATYLSSKTVRDQISGQDMESIKCEYQ